MTKYTICYDSDSEVIGNGFQLDGIIVIGLSGNHHIHSYEKIQLL